MVLALMFWADTSRPPLLISGDGSLVGVLTAKGRVLTSDRGAGFAAQQWLEDDGDISDQPTAAARPGFSGENGETRFDFKGWNIVHLKGKAAVAAVGHHCTTADLVILTGKAQEGGAPGGCQIIDQTWLKKTGSLAVWPGPDGTLRLNPTNTQNRLWTRRRPTASVNFLAKGQ
jgi:competence protein ComEC